MPVSLTKPIVKRSGRCALAIDAHRVGVVGGGTAAWATAIGLAKRGWDVTVDDLRPLARSTRIELVVAECVRQFDQLGIDKRTLGLIGNPCSGAWTRWDKDIAQEVDQSCSLWGNAWAIEKGRLDTLLRDRAMRLGVNIARIPSDADKSKNGAWLIRATGPTHQRSSDAEIVDELIAITICGTLRPNCSMTDSRLLIEALPEGWAYGLLGHGRCAGVALITDAAVPKEGNWRSTALEVLRRTERIQSLIDGLIGPLHVGAVPVACRWSPVQVEDRVVRVGDAQASHDPISGRGLWHALWSANHMAECLNGTGCSLADMEQVARRGYLDYLRQRQQLYARALHRFDSPFWSRRAHLGAIGVLRQAHDAQHCADCVWPDRQDRRADENDASDQARYQQKSDSPAMFHKGICVTNYY